MHNKPGRAELFKENYLKYEWHMEYGERIAIIYFLQKINRKWVLKLEHLNAAVLAQSLIF